MKRLTGAALAGLPIGVETPAYDRRAHGVGIVHLGIGAFHRAHQAVYTDDVLARCGGDWAIAGASLRGSGVHDQLAPQDCLFAVVSRSGAGDRYRIIGSVKDVFYAPGDPRAPLALMSAKTTRIVSLTVTEKGYCREPASGKLLGSDPGITHDLENPDTPRTAIGFLVRALDKRRSAGLAAFTVLSCDNLPDNGHSLAQVVLEFADLVDPALSAWIKQEVAFPCTMVDRIVPATSDDDLAAISDHLGCSDAAAVVTEPFTQWVIEENFANGRPPWEKAGALLVPDVAPYELIKLRLLNGAHSSLAYLGYLGGLEHVSDCMDNGPMHDFVGALMRGEIQSTLTPPPGFDVFAYIDQLRERFANPVLRHRCWQIAMDGTQKLPQRLLGTIGDRLKAGLSIDRLALAVAAWVRYASGTGLDGAPIDVRDPMAATLKQRLEPCLDDPVALAGAALGFTEVFGTDLANDPVFRRALTHSLTNLLTDGAQGAVAKLAKL